MIKDTLDKIDKLLVEKRKYAGYAATGGNTATVTWRICDPKDWDGDSCIEADIDIGFYYTPEEWEQGHIFVQEDFEVEAVEWGENVKYMGKRYRSGQAFPKQLRKHVMDFIDPGMNQRFKKGNWESFVQWELLKKLDRLEKF